MSAAAALSFCTNSSSLGSINFDSLPRANLTSSRSRRRRQTILRRSLQIRRPRRPRPPTTAAAPRTAAVPGSAHPPSPAAATAIIDPEKQPKEKTRIGKNRKHDNDKKPHEARHGKRRIIGFSGAEWRSAGKSVQRDFLIFGNDRRTRCVMSSSSAAVIVLLQKAAPLRGRSRPLCRRAESARGRSPPRCDTCGHSARAESGRRAPSVSARRPTASPDQSSNCSTGLAFERGNRDDGNLRFGFLIDFRAQRRQFFLGRRAQHARKIVHIALRLEVLDLLSPARRERRASNRSSSGRATDFASRSVERTSGVSFRGSSILGCPSASVNAARLWALSSISVESG